jgi:hypothetical protein
MPAEQSVPFAAGTTRTSGLEDSEVLGVEQSLRAHETCAVTSTSTVRRNTPVPLRLVACESNATNGPPAESAIDGFCADSFAGAPVGPDARLTNLVVPAVTSRSHTSLRWLGFWTRPIS